MTLAKYFSVLGLAAIGAALGLQAASRLATESMTRQQVVESARICARYARTEADFRHCYTSRGIGSPHWRP